MIYKTMIRNKTNKVSLIEVLAITEVSNSSGRGKETRDEILLNGTVGTMVDSPTCLTIHKLFHNSLDVW